jgi:hypothetical protein
VKRILAALAASFLCSTSAQAALIASYNFDGNALDGSGNNLNLSLFNGATYGAGHAGQALKLDGVNDFAAGAFTNVNLSAFTVEAWINVPTYGSNVHYVSFLQGNNYVVLGDYGSGVISTWANGLSPVQLDGGSAATTTNAWHHIAFTYGSNVKKIYLDGALVGSANTSGALSEPGSFDYGLTIGARYSRDTQYVNGLIDDVRIYDVALSQSQLGYFNSAPVSGPVPEPAAWATMIVGFGAAGTLMRRRRSLKFA